MNLTCMKEYLCRSGRSYIARRFESHLGWLATEPVVQARDNGRPDLNHWYRRIDAEASGGLLGRWPRLRQYCPATLSSQMAS